MAPARLSLLTDYDMPMFISAFDIVPLKVQVSWPFVMAWAGGPTRACQTCIVQLICGMTWTKWRYRHVKYTLTVSGELICKNRE